MHSNRGASVLTVTVHHLGPDGEDLSRNVVRKFVTHLSTRTDVQCVPDITVNAHGRPVVAAAFAIRWDARQQTCKAQRHRASAHGYDSEYLADTRVKHATRQEGNIMAWTLEHPHVHFGGDRTH
jgi:hypothetical protein